MLLTCIVHSVNVPIMLILEWPMTKDGYYQLINFVLAIQCFFCDGYALVIINIWYEDLHISYPFSYIHPHASSPDFFPRQNYYLFLPRPLTSWAILLLAIPYVVLSQATFPWNPPFRKVFSCCCLSRPHAADVHFRWTYWNNIYIPNQMTH